MILDSLTDNKFEIETKKKIEKVNLSCSSESQIIVDFAIYMRRRPRPAYSEREERSCP